MPIEESEDLHGACKKHGIDLILFAAPTTTKERLRKNINAASGFLYLVSVTGVTGDRKELPTELTNLIKETKKEAGNLPVAVGFGISKPEQIKEIIAAGADAVIVGSAFIRIIEENIGDRDKILTRLAEYTKELKKATY
jgi:tryptophan synthase alpha chain